MNNFGDTCDMFDMATSMALGGTTGMGLGLGNNSPHTGMMSSNRSIGNLTPHQDIKYCPPSAGSGASSMHSPISTSSSTPNSHTISINTASGSMGKCHGSVNSNGGNGGIGNHNSSANIIANNTSGSDLFGSKCKRKINFSNLGMPARGNQPATVARRNARERNRVKQVNNGFASLKQHIPLGHRSKKMSKVETLRCAVDYIRTLKGMLTIHNSLNSSSPMGSSVSTASGDIILMDDDDDDDDENEDEPTGQEHAIQQQMNGINNQRDAYALSSSSSSPTSTDFSAVVAHLPHHLAALHSHQHHQHQQLNSNNHLRQLSLSNQHHQHHLHHGTNAVSVAAALLVDSSGNGVTANSNQLSPTSSDDPSSPSYASEASYINSNANTKGNGMYDYENYEPVSPEDEELLDAIAWWQQS